MRWYFVDKNCCINVDGAVWTFFCSLRCRNATEQQAPAAHLPEVRRRQLRHRLWRLPHLHCPSGEHVSYVTVAQSCMWKSAWRSRSSEIAKWNFASLPGLFKALDGSRRGRARVSMAQVEFGWNPSSAFGTRIMCNVIVFLSSWQFILMAMSVWRGAGSLRRAARRTRNSCAL